MLGKKRSLFSFSIQMSPSPFGDDSCLVAGHNTEKPKYPIDLYACKPVLPVNLYYL
jgi:hypothetical protein